MARKTRGKGRGIEFDKYLAGQLRDPEARHHFEQRRLVHEVALAVRRMREEAGLTQARLASLVGATQPMIARLERGLDQRTPRWDTLHKIALALGRDLKVVFVRPRRARSAQALVEVQNGSAGRVSVV